MLRLKYNLQRMKCNFYLEIITCGPLIDTMDDPKFNASNWKEDSISAKRVKRTTYEALNYNQATTNLAFHSNETSKDKLSII